MKKKEYIKPEMKVYQIETQAILAVSEIETAKENDYSDDNVNNFIEDGGIIYIDYRNSLTPNPSPKGRGVIRPFGDVLA